MHMRSCTNCSAFLKLLLFLFILFFFCEVLIYYIVLIQCHWPLLNVPASTQPLKVMILADTHLLGSRNGHWFDKLRREWQMHRAFQTTMTLHSPEVVFFLGDVFDEGLWCGDTEFSYYINHFHSLFAVPEKTNVHVVVGNHDVGFHYSITKKLMERFDNAFNTSSVDILEIRGNNFVLMNSMALEQDGCSLCRQAELKLEKIGKILSCAKGNTKDCIVGHPKLIKYSKPILLQHFPLYRPSDAACAEPDSAPPEIINQSFREKWDCLSQPASDKVLGLLEPRVAFSGHTHHGCYVLHKFDIPEWTVPSFSWRNKQEPSFILASFTPEHFGISKCYMPCETTVYILYTLGFIFIFLWFCARKRLNYRSLKDNK